MGNRLTRIATRTGEECRAEDDVREKLRFYELGHTWDRTQIKCWKNTGQLISIPSPTVLVSPMSLLVFVDLISMSRMH
jgi:hypothetical protein